MAFGDWGYSEKTESRLSRRYPFNFRYQYFSPCIKEKLHPDGYWEGFRQGNKVYSTEPGNSLEPNLSPSDALGNYNNASLMTLPQWASLPNLSWSQAEKLREHRELVGHIVSKETITDIIGVTSSQVQQWIDNHGLILAPSRNILYLFENQSNVESLQQSEINTLQQAVDQQGPFLRRSQAEDALGQSLGDASKEGILFGPPVNAHFLTNEDIERLLNSRSPISSRLPKLVDSHKLVTDFSLIKSTLSTQMKRHFNLLEKLGVRYQGLVNINHSSQKKIDYLGNTIDSIPGTTSEQNLQTLIDENGYLMNLDDLKGYLGLNVRESVAAQNLGFYPSPLLHYDLMDNKDIEELAQWTPSDIRKEIASIESNEPNINHPSHVHSIIKALLGISGFRPNINTLTESELENLPGLDANEAQAIRDYIQKNQDILSEDDLEEALN